MENEDGRTANGPVDLRVRTKAFALQAIDLTSSLPKTGAGQVICGQLLRGPMAEAEELAKMLVTCSKKAKTR